ncbi:Glycolate oxidase [Pleurostoma richardsiae]|uniref:D-lactate dehydrogenase (cytochrome) n=1 Tax=Pleurostoma richardsiae TaxID=41990 RepID=A0AA38R273_9PEZI|nr:Glycolate oxidase [Pleurostoma richardsiae]
MVETAREIAAALGDELVSFDLDDIERHGYSDWSSSNSSGRPVAVVYPKTTDDVSRVAVICSRHDVPIVPFGAGSSIEGSFSSPYSGVVIDFAHMDKVIAFHPDDMDVVVQPGMNWVDLNRTMEEEGLFLPLDPSPTATVGGMVSTNCSGTNAFRYGTMKDWVINVTAVLADGRIIKTRRRPRKTSAGYNLTSLFVGAEGTLGIITEITLKLAVVPKETGVAVVSFPTIADAASAATKVIRSGIQVAAMELMDDTQMRIVNRHGSEAVRKTKWDETATLFLKFSGPTKEGIQGDISRVRELMVPHSPTKYFFARNKREEADLWAARKEALWTMTSIKPEGHAIWSTDVAVPISRLAEVIELSKKDGEKLGLFTSVVGHVGDGNFHEALMYDPKNHLHKAAVKEVVNRMMGRALEMEGTVSGEHAIGMGKIQCLMDELGDDTVEAMRLVKQALDPKWLLNPGKVFELPEGSSAVAADRA